MFFNKEKVTGIRDRNFTSGMAAREEAPPEPKDFQIGCSWLPPTPRKPASTTQLPICENLQANEPYQPNWIESGIYNSLNPIPQPILHGLGHSTNSVYEENLSNFDAWQASEPSKSCVIGDVFHTPNNYPMREARNFSGMSCQTLLALADAGGSQVALENMLKDRDCVGTSISPFDPCFNIPVGAAFGAGLDTSVLRGVGSVPCMPFDLNSAPRMLITDEDLSENIPFPFEPTTPQKNNKDDYQESITGKDAERGNMTGDSVIEPNGNKGKLHETIGQSSAAMSAQLQENHNPEKVGTEEADLLQTPQQKARRKKHRPKVVTEGKKKSTPKSTAKTPSAPRETARVKRKYVRKKGVSSPSVEEKSRIGSNNKEVSPTGRKRANKPVVVIVLDEETPKATGVMEPQNTRGSCKKALNFNSDDQVGNESSSYAINQLQEDNLSTMDPLKDSTMFGGEQTLQSSGFRNIVFSNVTHDKETNTAQMRMNLDSSMMPKGPGDSFCSSVCFTPEKQVRGLKRQNTESEICNRNEAGMLYNFMQACSPTFSQNADRNDGSPGFQVPAIYRKKKKIEKGHDMVASSSQQTGPTLENHVRLDIHSMRGSLTSQIESIPNQGSSSGQSQVTNPGTDGTRNARKISEDQLALGPTEKIKKKRPRGPTKPRNLPPLPQICEKLPASTSRAVTTSRVRQKIEFQHEPPTRMEALAANTCSTMATKKRSKGSMLINSPMQNLYNHQMLATTSMGPPLALTWTHASLFDAIVEQLSQLDLNESSQASLEKWNTVMAYQRNFPEQHAIVPYQRSGDVVPFDQPFVQVRRGRPRAKVSLDDETTRVWKLLLENINSEGIDGTDEEKAKWWEEERSVFIGRAESFIARMHLVQGDRRFSPWKGSVVDSVVGVFLTQNVSDHLSSSAFMAMAARFPLKAYTEMCQEFESYVMRDDNSITTSRNSTDGSILKDTLGYQSPNTSKSGRVVSTTNRSVSLIEDEVDAEDTFSSRTPDISSQNSSDSPIAQTAERSDSCLPSTLNEPIGGAGTNRFKNPTSFVELLQMAGTVALHEVYEGGDNANPMFPAETIELSSTTLCHAPNSESQGPKSDLSKQNSKVFNSYSNSELCSVDISELSSESASGTTFQKITGASFEDGLKPLSTHATSSNNGQGEIYHKGKMQEVPESPICQQNSVDVTGSSKVDDFKNPNHKEVNSNKNGPEKHSGKKVDGSKAKAGRPKKENVKKVDWDLLRKQTLIGGTERAKTANTMDSVDWEAVRCADVKEIAQTIKERGMNNMLAERIKDFLNRIVRDHGSIDLEWLRDVPPDKAKEYLLSIWGLGLKSVECVRLLTLHHLAFPVDTNVGRIAVRLGWVPLQPLPESLQLHLLEMYPVLESIQKYLWPRLCKLDQRTLYELHYQMITFGKVFCTKSKPNCNACPMRGECRHFASAFASARLSLPAPEEKSIVNAIQNKEAVQHPMKRMNTLQLPPPEASGVIAKYEGSNSQPIIEEPPSPEPIIEMPTTPEEECAEVSQCDIENAFNEDPDEIPTIKLDMEEFSNNLQKIIQQNGELHEGNMSNALVALTSEAASIPVPKLKNMNRLRTEHRVYELPDSHPLLEGMEKREPDDPSHYLLAIWTPGETKDSTEPPNRRCNSHEFEELCTDVACSSCNAIREDSTQTVRGTILIPCRTAMRGSFPLNGTYFQVNEVFSDHASSLSPINVPRQWLWNLPRRTVYFGSSIPTIFKGLTTEGIQYCFWKGFVCVRGFDRETRAPRPLIARLHLAASKLAAKGKGKVDEN